MDNFFADYLERFEAHYNDLEQAISGLPVTALDWVPGPDMNSLCVLVVHICGAARYWVGDLAGGEPSGRDRAAEFTAHGLTEDELRARLRASRAYIAGVLERLTLDDLARLAPAPGRPISPGSEQLREFAVGWSLLHALEHTALHLRHAQITRQLWDRSQSVVKH